MVAVVAALAALAVGACGDDGPASGDGPPVVVATTPIAGDIVASALGDAAEVVVLMPRGADPHAFEPSARQIAELESASLIVANGLGLESGLREAIDTATDAGVPLVEIAPAVDPIEFAGADAHDDVEREEDDVHGEDGAHDHGDLDPHVWLDPLRMADAVPLIADAFVQAVPDADADAVRVTADAYAEELRALDAEIEEVLVDVAEEDRVLVTNHDNLGYFADRYGFEILGVVIPGGDTLAAPSAGDLDELVEEIELHGARLVVADEGVASDLADVLAQEVGGGVEVVALYTDTLGDEDGDSGTYIDMMRTNAERLAEALR